MDSKKVKDVSEAKQKIVEGQLTIWSTRLSTLVEIGDIKGALDAMSTPVENLATNNCDCHNITCDSVRGTAVRSSGKT